MTIPGVIAQEWRARNLPVPTLDDVVFLSTWDGTNGGTNAIDESPIGAPLTWFGTQLTNTQHLFDATCSLRCDAITDYVSAPANPLYDIGDSDFTIESFVRVPTFQTSAAAQWVGVWQNEESNTFNQWRALHDSLRFYFQCKVGNAIQQYSFVHGMLTNVWYYMVWCRYAGRLRAFMGELGGMTALKFSGNMFSRFDALSGVPLYIGGNQGGSTVKAGANAFFQNMRVTRGAWYRSDDIFPVPTSKFGYGTLAPHLHVDTDAIYAPIINFGQVFPLRFNDVDTFPAPLVARTPNFVNSTTTVSGTGNTASCPLIGSRTTGNLLMAFIVVNTNTPGPIFATGQWNLTAVNPSSGSTSVWIWRMVDGIEVAPNFGWTNAATWHARMYQFNGVAQIGAGVSPIGATLQSGGASANLLVNSGVGLTTTKPMSSVVALTMTAANSQTIPLPSGFIETGAPFFDPNGSDHASIQHQSVAGGVSGPVNLTIAPALWHGYLIELCRPAP